MALKVVSAAAMVVLTATGAFAADVPYPAYPSEVPVAPVAGGVSCFLGIHAGGAFSQDQLGNSGSFGSNGFVGGGQGGCDYQFAYGWLLGGEARIARTSLTSHTPGTATDLTTGFTAPAQVSVNNNFLGSATARAGYNFGASVLVYARGGVAFTGEKTDAAFTEPVLGAVDPLASTTRAGWTAGVGVDWAFTPHWSVEVKYDYYDFGSSSFTLIDPNSGAVVSGNLRDRIQTITVGSSYHF